MGLVRGDRERMTPPLRILGKPDRAKITAMLACAFADDPAMAFVFPDPALRAKRLPRLFGLLFDADALAGLRLATAGDEAATLWRGPGQAHVPMTTMLRQTIPLLATFGTALGRALALANAIEAHFPGGDYWYLHLAGCDPAQQGRGFGAAAVCGGLARISGSALPAYLETATERNLGFYQGLGFAVTGEWRVPKGGPRFWSMLRPV